MILSALKRLLYSDDLGKALCQSPSMAFEGNKMDCVLKLVDDLLTSIVIDLNHEIEQGALTDYKSDLKSKNSVEKVTGELLRSYEKDKARGKAESIGTRLGACGVRKGK